MPPWKTMLCLLLATYFHKLAGAYPGVENFPSQMDNSEIPVDEDALIRNRTVLLVETVNTALGFFTINGVLQYSTKSFVSPTHLEPISYTVSHGQINSNKYTININGTTIFRLVNSTLTVFDVRSVNTQQLYMQVYMPLGWLQGLSNYTVIFPNSTSDTSREGISQEQCMFTISHAAIAAGVEITAQDHGKIVATIRYLDLDNDFEFTNDYDNVTNVNPEDLRKAVVLLVKKQSRSFVQHFADSVIERMPADRGDLNNEDTKKTEETKQEMIFPLNINPDLPSDKQTPFEEYEFLLEEDQITAALNGTSLNEKIAKVLQPYTNNGIARFPAELLVKGEFVSTSSTFKLENPPLQFKIWADTRYSGLRNAKVEVLHVDSYKNEDKVRVHLHLFSEPSLIVTYSVVPDDYKCALIMRCSLRPNKGSLEKTTSHVSGRAVVEIVRTGNTYSRKLSFKRINFFYTNTDRSFKLNVNDEGTFIVDMTWTTKPQLIQNSVKQLFRICTTDFMRKIQQE